MAWLDLKGWSEQLSSVATNAADFTRDVLAEGTTEVSDHETELKITEDKVQRLESIIASLKAENERLSLMNSELEENAESSELQINTISSQYRSMVQEKEDEIKLLKERQNNWQNFQSEDLIVAGSPTALATSTSTSSLSSSALQVPGDHDINDLIGAQQEINTLSSELARFQAECEHWRQVASSKQQPKFEVGGDETHLPVEETLSTKVKDLESRLQREIDQSQHELSALQDVHSQKLKNLSRKHQSEIEKYKDKVEELEEALSHAQESGGAGAVVPQREGSDKIREKLNLVQEELEQAKEDLAEAEKANAGLQSEISRLKLRERQTAKHGKDMEGEIERLRKEKEDLEREKLVLEQTNQEQARTVEEMRDSGGDDKMEIEELRKLLQAREQELEEVRAASHQVSSELLATKHRLLASLDDNHASASAMLKDVQSTRRKVASDANALKCQLFQEKQELVKEMIEIGQKVTEGQRSIEDLEVVSQEVQDETVDLINKMGRTDTRDTLEENGRLLDQVSRLQSQLADLNTTCESLTSDKEHSESVIAKLNEDISILRKEKGLPDADPRSKAVDVVAGDAQQAGEVHSDTQSFDGEFDDSLMFASIKQKYPEAASAMEEQLVQFEEIQKDWEIEKEALEQVVISVRGQLKQKEQALKELTENQDLSETMTREMESKVADLRRQLEAAETSEGKAKTNLEMAVKEKEQLSEQINGLHNVTEELLAKVSDEEKQKDSLKQQLDESRSNLEELTEALNRTTQELGEKNQSVLDISQMRDELHEDMKRLDLQQEQALAEVLKSKSLIQAEMDKMRQENEGLKQELEDGKRSLEQLESLKLESEEKRRDIEEEVRDLKAETTELKEKNIALELKNRDLEQKKASSESSQSEVEKLKKALSEMSKNEKVTESEKDVEIEELKQEVDVQKESYERLNESHTILTKCNKLLEEEKSALKKRLDIISKGMTDEGTGDALARMEEECSELRRHSDKIQDRCSEMEASLAKTQHEKISLREELTRKNNDLEKMSRKLEEANMTAMEAKESLELEQSQRAKLEQEIKELNVCIDEQSKHHQQALLEAVEDKTSMESEAVTTERERHLKDIKRKEEEIDELKRRCEDLALDLSGTKEALNTTVSNHEQLADLLKEKESDIKILADENAFFVEAMNEAKEKESKLKEALEKGTDLEQQVEMLHSEKEQLQKRVVEFEELNLTSSEEGKTLGLITDLEFEISDLQTSLQEKEATIDKLNKDLETVRQQGESQVEDKVKALEEELRSKQDNIAAIEEENSTLARKCATLEQQLSSNIEESKTEAGNLDEIAVKLKAKTTECDTLQDEMHRLEAALKAAQQDLAVRKISEQNWTAQIDDLQKEIDIYDESLKAVQEKRTIQDSKIKSLLEEIKDKEAEITQLSSEKESMSKSVSEKENKAKQLQEEVDNLRNFVQSEHNAAQIDPDNSLQLGHLNGISDSNVATVQSNLESEPLAISDSEKQLEKMVQEREREIASLKEQNQTAMKLLDDKSRTIMGNSVLVDLHKLQMQKKTLESERHQMVTVLNDKTRECSNLKTEVHKLMKIVSAEKSALEKAQEDYKDLQKSMQKPQNEMQKEALQNLSYLIQEKDLEIGALKQKNETLVQVLQTASPNNSMEINKVLEEKETLEKENKMLKEERDQLVVSIHQKHHESVTYYEEVQRLAGVISQESQKHIDLQKKFDGLSTEKKDQDRLLTELKTQLEDRANIVRDLEQEVKSHQQMFADLELELADVKESFYSLEEEKKLLQNELHGKGKNLDISNTENNGSKYEEEIRKLKAELDMLRRKPIIEETFTRNEGEQEEMGIVEKRDEEAKHTVVDQSDGQSNQIELVQLQTELQTKEGVIQNLQSEIERLERTLADRNERINQKTNEALQKESEAAILRQQVDIQNQSLLDHERVVQERQRGVDHLQQQCVEKERLASSLQNQLQHLTQKIAPLEADLKNAKEEYQALHHSVVKKDAENRSLQDMSNGMAMQLREKEFELGAMKEKNKTLTQLVKELEAGSQGDVERMLRETEAMQRQAQMFQQERDQAVLLLQKNDADMAGLRKEIQDKGNQEKKLKSELDRLRNHLIEMEDSYMTEALQAEEREKQLRDRLTHAEENLRTNSTAVQSASNEASVQIENLLDQLASATNEKDQVLLELAASQEQCQQYSTSLGNLQMVLEQFQQEKDEMVAQDVEIYQKRAEEKEKIAEHLFKQNMEIQQKLSDTQDALESASRLTEQLDRKEEAISRLRDEIFKKDEDLNNYKKQFEEVSSAAETKVDKPLVKNLFINYVHAPPAKKDEVTHLITSLLNFNDEEMDKLQGRPSGGWFSGLFGGARTVSPPSTPRNSNLLEKSFSQQFVKFLEEESTPTVKVRLPVEEMTKERAKPPAFNPFSAPVPSQSPFIPSSPPATKGLAKVGPSQLMVNPLPVTPSVPQAARIAPVPPTDGASGRNSPGARGSLRDVLQ